MHPPQTLKKYSVSHNTLMFTVLSFPDKLGTEAGGELCACSNTIHRASGSTHSLLSWTIGTSCPTHRQDVTSHGSCDVNTLTHMHAHTSLYFYVWQLI